MQRSLLLALVALCFVGLLAAPALGAGSQSFTLRDHVGIAWQNEPVHFALSFKPGELEGPARAAVRIKDGPAVLSQCSDVQRHPDGSISSFNVWIMATVPANGQTTYVVSPGQKPSAPGSGDTLARVADGRLTLLTAPQKAAGVVLPAGAQTYPFLVPHSQVPGPIQGLLFASGRQTGPGRFDIPWRVLSHETQILDQGPLFSRATVRYQFETGYWTFTARVFRDTPIVLIDDELDTGDSGLPAEGFDRFYSIPLSGGGFKPSQLFFGGRCDREDLTDLAKNRMAEPLLKAAGLQAGWYASPIHGFTLKLDKPDEFYYLLGYPSGLPRIGGLARAVEPGGEAVGVVGLHTARWRNPLSLRLASDGKDLLLRLPLQNYNQAWSYDGFGRTSPNYTGRTVGAPDSLVRRSFGIMLSPAEDEKQNLLASLFAMGGRMGAHPLDLVKDWTLDWPDPMANAAWAPKTSERAQKVIDLLRGRIALNRAQGHLSRFSMGYHFGFYVHEYPELTAVLNSTADLTAADRRTLRQLVAFVTYDMHLPDTFPWGMGFHLNNPNMTLMACEARAKSSILIPDHPLFKTWGDVTVKLVNEYKRRFTRDSGAVYENPHYTLGVTFASLSQLNEIFLTHGLGDAFNNDLTRRSVRFTFDWLTPPDPRFLGHRTALPVGNGSYQSYPPEMVGRFVDYYKTRDANFAGQIAWVANQTLPDDKKVKTVPEVTPKLGSVYYPDYGVAFRHGFGTPYETLFHMMAGNCDGHYEWEQDQMTYTLYAKGQPINLHFGNGYFPMLCRPWMRNRVSIDHKFEMSERNPTQVLATGIAPDAQYLHATRQVDQIRALLTDQPVESPPGKWAPEESKSWPARPANIETIPLTVWHRQVLFLNDPDPKGPNYFVIRDAFSGTPTRPTDVSFWFLATGMEKRGEVYHYNGQCKVDMDVFVATPAPGSFEPKADRYKHPQQPYGRLVGFDPAYHPDGKLGEEQIALRIAQPAGKGYLTVLYPRLKENDPPATFARLDESVVRVETPVSTDYVFVSPFPIEFKDARVHFRGRSGCVRFYKSGKVTLTDFEGGAMISLLQPPAGIAAPAGTPAPAPGAAVPAKPVGTITTLEPGRPARTEPLPPLGPPAMK